jgi:hypothetical protein
MQFDNSFIDSAFEANHFFISTKSKGNYNSTPLSIGASFNLQYFNKDLEGDSTVAKSLLQGWYTLRKSQIPVLLTNEDYEVLNFGLSQLDRYPSEVTEAYSEAKIKPLFLETLWGRIKRDIWWNIYHIEFIKKQRYAREKVERRLHISRNNRNFKYLMSELKVQNNKPKFVFCHLLLPHSPFYLNKYGIEYTQPHENNGNFNKMKYLEQVEYTNQLILKILEASNLRFPRPRVIIVEGDHGFRIPGAERDSQFMNLNAYYFSDHDYNYLYDSISPVNSFRVILNKYFGSNLLLLKDSTILLK